MTDKPDPDKAPKPWTMLVTAPRKDSKRRVVVRPRFDPNKPPWRPLSPPPIPEDEARFYEHGAPQVGEPGEEPAPSVKKRPSPKPLPSTRLVCAQRYAAVEAASGAFGLIDNGPEMGGVKPLLMHVPRREPSPWRVLNAIRPGSYLQVRAGSGGEPSRLRVRFTTPARYYPPGARVSTLAMGVDAADWRCLAADAPHI